MNFNFKYVLILKYLAYLNCHAFLIILILNLHVLKWILREIQTATYSGETIYFFVINILFNFNTPVGSY